MDSKYPPWQTVFYHFTQFKERGIWENILDAVVVNERKKQDREDIPSLLAIDSQSDRRTVLKKFNSRMKKRGLMVVKMPMRGRLCGRKRTILVDSLGLPWSIKVTAANISDNQAGILAVDLLAGKVPRLKKITADSGYKSDRRCGRFQRTRRNKLCLES